MPARLAEGQAARPRARGAGEARHEIRRDRRDRGAVERDREMSQGRRRHDGVGDENADADGRDDELR
ncbi:hypothetical protein GCM10011392_18210 [Wenxinia marina]|nr:hypothetical protein GCM10011392_18210 [Wenxinia marina]